MVDLGRGEDHTDGGRVGAAGSLIEQVYSQLRAIAQRQISDERVGHTLQATALVHEAYVRLARLGVVWSSPQSFYFAAAQAMRRILIEHARSRGRIKRGAGRARLDLDLSHVAELGETEPDRIVALEDAIRRLEGIDARAASVVNLRFYAGLGVEQAAAALGLSPRTVKRDWEFARAWLYEALSQERNAP